jgi:hypothetical protein
MEYYVTGYIKISAETVVEANSPEDALRLGREKIRNRNYIETGGVILEDWDVNDDTGEAALIIVNGKPWRTE